MFLTKEINQHPKEGKAYYYMTKIHMYNEAYSDALKQVNLAISNLNDSDTVLARSWIAKGDIYQQISDTVKFESAYTKALSLFPKLAEVYWERASSYANWNMNVKAKADLLKVLELDETHVGARKLLCSILYDEEKYEEVITQANKIIVLSPEFVDAYDLRASAYFQLDRYDLAIEDGYSALTLDEENTRLRFKYIMYSKKNYSLGIAKISTMINEYPQKDIWYLLRAEILLQKKEFDKALKEYDHIFTIIPASSFSFYFAKRAEVYTEMGLHDLALNDYSASIERDSTDASYYSSRADEYRHLGKMDLAIADCDRAIELSPETAYNYLRRGWVYEELKADPQTLIADYTAALEIDRNLASAYLYRGRVYQRSLKDTSKANDDFRQVIALDTETGSMDNQRQFGYAGLGMVVEAKAWNSKLLNEFPTDANYYDAACLYSILKMPKESIAYLDTAFQKGYRDFIHLGIDDDLDNIRQSMEFKSLISRWQSKYANKTVQKSSMPNDESKILGTYSIPFKLRLGDTFEIASKVNGLPLKMTFDSGAAVVTISQMEVDFMIKHGYLSERDYIGKESYVMANGMTEEAKTIMLRSVEIGGLVLKNVKASVMQNREAGLLFGQSAMGRYATITIDNKKKQLIISGK